MDDDQQPTPDDARELGGEPEPLAPPTPPGSSGPPEPAGSPEPLGPRPVPLGSTFGTAVGAAMLGFEQAFRDTPPAQVVAAEHAPRRGGIGTDGDLVIEIPGLPE